MFWFKVDGKLPFHRKTRAVRRSHPAKRRDASPFGIWVLAGAYSDDGFVPLEVIEEWDDDAEEYAQRLVDAGLWHPAERDGEEGYEFHDWADQNPTDPSISGSFGNHIRWHKKKGKRDPECPHCEAESSGRYRGDDRGDIAPDIGGESLSVPISVPNRTHKNSRSRSKNDDPPERFDEFWNTYDRKVSRPKAISAYRSALKKPGVTPDMLIAAASTYIAWQRSEGKHPEYTKHPTTWLNQECWSDERPARQQPQSRVQQHLALARQLAEQEQEATVHKIGGHHDAG